MILLVDEGNTRVKAWWLCPSGRVLRQAVYERLGALLADVGMSSNVTRLCLASVRGSEAYTAWQAAATMRRWHLDIARVDTARLPTCYAMPERLGIDRWLAVLAVAGQGRPALVVDAGTAVTLDVYLPVLGHVGGYILPGLRLQREMLATQTARVSIPEPDWSDIALGNDTASCVGRGGLRALVALVRDVQAELPTSTTVWLTGGDAGLLSPWLPTARCAPNLMLHGLARCFAVPLQELDE